jgi:hypothetical protein
VKRLRHAPVAVRDGTRATGLPGLMRWRNWPHWVLWFWRLTHGTPVCRLLCRLGWRQAGKGEEGRERVSFGSVQVAPPHPEDFGRFLGFLGRGAGI